MQEMVCLVTGANRGIGRATVEGLARLGATVLMLCRDREAGERARAAITTGTGNRNLELLIADLSLPADVRRVADEIRASRSRLDLLVSNAGTLLPSRTVTVDGIETTFAVNHLAGFILISELTGLLRASAPSRVVIVGSEAHRRVVDPEDWASANGYSGRAAYNRSKLANVLFSSDLARRLNGSGVTVNCCHPGWVNTPVLERMYDRWWLHWLWPVVRNVFTITPAEGAKPVLYLATSPELAGITGEYFKHNRPAATSPTSRDAAIAARLWNLSERLSGEIIATR